YRPGSKNVDNHGVFAESGNGIGGDDRHVDEQRFHHSHGDERWRRVQRHGGSGRPVQLPVPEQGHVHVSLHAAPGYGGKRHRSVPSSGNLVLRPPILVGITTNARPADCAEGDAALGRGAWGEARAAFDAALAARESPEALEGLALAAWWLDLADVLFDARER